MLTPEGEFVKGKNNGTPLEVGEKKSFFIHMRNLKQIVKNSRFGPYHLVLLLSFLLCFLIINPLKKDQAFAYVTMDMDSSIEFVLDENLHIIVPMLIIQLVRNYYQLFKLRRINYLLLLLLS